MKSKAQIIPFPRPADPNINTLFDDFLKEESSRIKKSTLKRYNLVIELFRHCLDMEGLDFLSDREYQLYEKLSLYKGLGFCSIFGADKIIPAIPAFLGDFMIRKVAASESLLRSSGTVIKRFVAYLMERGLVPRSKAKKAIAYASEASKVLPAVERLARLLYEYAHNHPPKFWNMEIDDFFTIEEIMPGKIILSSSSTEFDMIELRLPEEIIAHCRVGWHVNLLLGKTPRGWQIIETGNVYPDI